MTHKQTQAAANKTMHRSGRSAALDDGNFFGGHSVMVAVRRSTNAAILRLQFACSTKLTFIAKRLKNADDQRFGGDHIGSKSEPELRTNRTDHRDRETMRGRIPIIASAAKVALTFIGRYTEISNVGRFGNVKPQH